MKSVAIDGIPVDALTFQETVERIVEMAIEGAGGYACTPNVDHIVKARGNGEFRRAIMGSRLRVPDGMGIVYGARIAGTPLRGTVTGRLLPDAVGRALAPKGLALAVFGGPPGTAEPAADALRQRGSIVAEAISPSLEFRIGSPEDDEAVARLLAAKPTVLFVGLGAPKQELWMARRAGDLPGIVLVGVGAAIDVLAGRRTAPPTWMTRVGLEWLYRLAHEPRRLARRYLWDDPRFFVWMLQRQFSRAPAPDEMPTR